MMQNSMSVFRAFLFLFGFCAIAHADDRPNILFAFADDWGRYASAYAKSDGPGTVNDVIRTPAFDEIASRGVLFRNAFVCAPSCTPCRSSLLSGRYFFRTGRGAILNGAVWDQSIPTYPLLLEQAGYHIGFTYKVWSPGAPQDAPYGGKQNAFEKRGKKFNGFSQQATRMVNEGMSVGDAKQTLLAEVAGNFDDFLSARPDGKPFCYWFGPTNVHRKWVAGSGKKLWGIEPDALKGKLPQFLPDVPVVRQDFADYLGEAMAFDQSLKVILDHLRQRGELENTIVVVSGDHGAPGFPRGKCNLYDFGVAVPLAVRWPKSFPAGRVVDDFVNLKDLAPTFLEAGGVEIPDVMSGKSLMPVLTSDRSGQVDPERSWVVTGRERHVASAREGWLPYPQRAIRTKEFLLVHNFAPSRWPVGSPKGITDERCPTTDELVNHTRATFADFDASPTKAWLVEHRKDNPEFYDLAFAKRPQRELYVLADDPDQINNVAQDERYASIVQELDKRLSEELRRNGDPRTNGDYSNLYEKPPYAGDPTALKNWPEFRGPFGDGHTAMLLPAKIDESSATWKVAIHGKGWSSPVVWGNQIWLTTATENGREMSAVCVDVTSGKILHDIVVKENKEPAFCHPMNSYASPTPAIDKDHVYLHFGSYATVCLNNKTGEEVWRREDLKCDHFRGPASSPILYDDKLIVAYDGFDLQYVVALDRATGRTIWKTDREIDYGTDNGDLKKAYCTASVIDVHGSPQLVYPSAVATIAYDPSDGTPLWTAYHDGMNTSARPVTHEDLVFLTNGMGGMVAVRPHSAGDPEIVWDRRKAVPKKSSLLVIDGMIYMVSDEGVFACVDPATGKDVWSRRIRGEYAASPIFDGEKIYCFSREGDVTVIKPGKSAEILSESKIGEGFMASPAVSGSRLILRGKKHLYCFGR